jgi:hypothetical protein
MPKPKTIRMAINSIMTKSVMNSANQGTKENQTGN